MSDAMAVRVWKTFNLIVIMHSATLIIVLCAAFAIQFEIKGANCTYKAKRRSTSPKESGMVPVRLLLPRNLVEEHNKGHGIGMAILMYRFVVDVINALAVRLHEHTL